MSSLIGLTTMSAELHDCIYGKVILAHAFDNIDLSSDVINLLEYILEFCSNRLTSGCAVCSIVKRLPVLMVGEVTV